MISLFIRIIRHENQGTFFLVRKEFGGFRNFDRKNIPNDSLSTEAESEDNDEKVELFYSITQ